MARGRNRVGKARRDQQHLVKSKKKSESHPDQLLANIAYLDQFPYNPSYEFNGFRSGVGALMTFLFVFFVLTNIIVEIIAYNDEPPNTKVSSFNMAEYRESRNVPAPTIAATFLQDGVTSFYDPTFLQIRFLQAFSFQASLPALEDTGNRACTLLDSDGYVEYLNLRCPISDQRLEGNDNLPNFRYIQVEVEQCVNRTQWNEDTLSYDVVGGTTTTGTTPCASQTDIDTLMGNGLVMFFIEESDLRTDKQDRVPFRSFRKIAKRPLANFFLHHEVNMRLRRVKTTKRYVFDGDLTNTNYLKTTREDETMADLVPSLRSCLSTATVDNCDTDFHIVRMSLRVRLDTTFELLIRESIALYDMFTNFGGVTFFFFVLFGGGAVSYNKYRFKSQTKGLDLRKLDNSQFDKFGNLIDKSFQMPRELQDMSAE